jgi:hypothetical protein
MIELLHRIGVEIHEIAGHVERHQLPVSLPIVRVAAEEAAQQERAMLKVFTFPNYDRACRHRPHFRDRAF